MVRDVKKNTNNDLIVNANPKSSFSEAIKSIRTNLQFSAVNKEIKVILLTSPEPGDGKSFVSANLAVAYAQENKHVLVIDCDLRKGRQADIFDIPKSTVACYTSMILNYNNDRVLDENKHDLKYYIFKSNIANIDVIQNGPIPPNPIELLSSKRNEDLLMELRTKYDIIILDCPPVLGLSDSLIMSKYSDANIVVVSAEKTKLELLNEVKQSFIKVNSKITGVIINKAKVKSNSYYGYYSSKYYGEE